MMIKVLSKTQYISTCLWVIKVKNRMRESTLINYFLPGPRITILNVIIYRFV